MFTFSCQSKKYDLEIKTLQTYGDNTENIMSNIGDLDFYHNDLYILDYGQMIIFQFDLTGRLINKIKLRSGRGPGEFTMGLMSLKVLNDSLIAVADQILKSVQLISHRNANYKYIKSIKLDFNPYKIFYLNSLLYISGDAYDYILHVFDLNGNIKKKILSQYLSNNQPTPWYSELVIDNDNSIYATDPYKSEITKWNKVNKWKFTSTKNLIEPPIIIGKGGMGQLKGWTNLFVFKKYLIASTYNLNSYKERENLPQIIIIDKNNGKLIMQKSVQNPFKVKSYLNGDYIFKINYEQFPSVSRIKIKLTKK